jgi:hypothetical protein
MLMFSAALWGSAALAHAEFRLYDANGQFIGIVDVQGADKAFVPSLGCTVDLAIKPDTNGVLYADLLYDWYAVAINYESTDCSGAGYIVNAGGIHKGFIANRCLKVKETGALFLVQHQNPKKFNAQSYREINGTGYGSCVTGNQLYGDDSIGYPVPILPLQGTLPFTTPLALPLEYRHVNPMDIDGDNQTNLPEAIYSLQKAAGVR